MLSSSQTTMWCLHSGRWDASHTYTMILTIMCELSKLVRNLVSITELYTIAKNCLYFLTEKHLLYLDLLCFFSQTHFDSNESRRAVYNKNIIPRNKIFEFQLLFEFLEIMFNCYKIANNLPKVSQYSIYCCFLI